MTSRYSITPDGDVPAVFVNGMWHYKMGAAYIGVDHAPWTIVAGGSWHRLMASLTVR